MVVGGSHPLGEGGGLRATPNLGLVHATPVVHLRWLVSHPIGRGWGAATPKFGVPKGMVAISNHLLYFPPKVFLIV